MDKQKILDAILYQNTEEFLEADRELADKLLTSLRQTSSDYHDALLLVLGNVEDHSDFVDLIRTISCLPARDSIQLIAVATTGDATQEFMKTLDQDRRLQGAVDIAFRAHMKQVPDWVARLERAREFLERSEEQEENGDS